LADEHVYVLCWIYVSQGLSNGYVHGDISSLEV